MISGLHTRGHRQLVPNEAIRDEILSLHPLLVKKSRLCKEIVRARSNNILNGKKKMHSFGIFSSNIIDGL